MFHCVYTIPDKCRIYINVSNKAHDIGPRPFNNRLSAEMLHTVRRGGVRAFAIPLHVGHFGHSDKILKYTDKNVFVYSYRQMENF